MEEELLKIIYDYSFSYRLGDETFIRMVNELLFNHYNVTQEEIKKISFFNNNDTNTLACFDVNERELSFNIENIHVLSEKKDISFINKSSEYFFRNFFILTSVIHEYIHILQHREKKELDNILLSSDKKKLLDYSYIFWDNKIRRKHNITNKFNPNSYKLYHDYFPTERMAMLESRKKVMELIKIDSTFDGILRNYFEYRYINMLLFGYDVNNTLYRETSPLEEYLFKMDLYCLYKDFSFHDINFFAAIRKAKENYSIDERLFYGFPIDRKEKDELLHKRNELSKTLVRRL